MASKRALGSFRLLLLWDSLPFLPLPIPSCDKLHSSHSFLFRSRLPLLACDHTGLTFRLPFFPPFYCFSAHRRAVSSCNKLSSSASKVSRFFKVTLGGSPRSPHSFRFFFRSCLLNFFCGQERFNTDLENVPGLAGSVFGPAGLFASLDPRFMAPYKFFPLCPSSEEITFLRSSVKDANSSSLWLSLIVLCQETFLSLLEVPLDGIVATSFPPVFVGVTPLFGALRTLGGGSPPWRLIL